MEEGPVCCLNPSLICHETQQSIRGGFATQTIYCQGWCLGKEEEGEETEEQEEEKSDFSSLSHDCSTTAAGMRNEDEYDDCHRANHHRAIKKEMPLSTSNGGATLQ